MGVKITKNISNKGEIINKFLTESFFMLNLNKIKKLANLRINNGKIILIL